MKYKGELINRYFLVAVPHPKGGEIICTCLKDNFIGENDEYRETGICAFDY